MGVKRLRIEILYWTEFAFVVREDKAKFKRK
jgi:hypothetical protein